MTRFRFIHAADLHLDSPFEGIGRVAPTIAEALRDASLDAWDALVRLTIEREAAFLLLAGDIYDGAERGVRAQLRFRRGLEQLSDRGIQVFIVHGNHDPLDGWSAIRNWPQGVTVFGSTEVQAVPVIRDGVQIATVHGISYAQRDMQENLALRYRRGEHAGLQIGLLHCNVGGNQEHALYSSCTIEDLRAAGMDYWALGHCHRLDLVTSTYPLIAYPGCLQGRSTRQCDRGPKGALVLEADDQGVQMIDPAPLDRIRFVTIDTDIADIEDLPDLERTLMRGGATLRMEHEGRGLLVRATLVGRGPLHRDLLRPGSIEAVLRELRRACDGEEPFVWWEGIDDRTRPLLDLDAIRGRGDFSAELLQSAARFRGDDSAREQWLYQEFEALRRAGPQRWIPGLDTPDDQELLDTAERLALDLLEDDQGS